MHDGKLFYIKKKIGKKKCEISSQWHFKHCPSHCCGLSVDGVQQCGCWHHHFKILRSKHIRRKLSDIKTTGGIHRWPNEFQTAYWRSYEKGIKTSFSSTTSAKYHTTVG